MIQQTLIQLYLPASCYAATRQKYPTKWQTIINPYITEIKRFIRIYKTKKLAVLKLAKMSNPTEIELIQAASFHLSKQNIMSFQDELSIIQSELKQYKNQLLALETNVTNISAEDKSVIAKYYRDKIDALTIREKQLTDAIDFEGELITAESNTLTESNN